MPENMRPVANTRDETFLGLLKFYGRMLVDFQSLTIFRHLKKTVPEFRGRVLDVGCGQSPYKFLLPAAESSYVGIDTAQANHFGYDNREVVAFNGSEIPFGDNSFDGLICTEVLEHVFNYRSLVNEMHRVLRPGARGVITVPWSARYHFIPHDFFRFSPSALEKIFSSFSSVEIYPRGTDIVVVANIVVVMWWQQMFPPGRRNWLLATLWGVFGTPVVLLVVGVAHLALLVDLGSKDQPLGYSVFVVK